MKLLHTSDWHLGRSLHGRSRYDEFEQFLSWLLQALLEHQCDALLIAGDIFDTTTPSHRAQSLYYQFLCRVAAQTPCRHVVIIAGNHDSPSFLDAPAELLKALQVHVVGAARDTPADEVVTLYAPDGQPELLVCAVPYLRDRDLRRSEAGESAQDKERRLLDGLRQHYAQVIHHAQQTQQALHETHGWHVPIVGMGHLFTAGGQTVEGDGVRELYVGSLAHVEHTIFTNALDYVALGHLHKAQRVGGQERIRYSGSPLPMGFGEASQTKFVCLVNLSQPAELTVDTLPIPVFRPLYQLKGDLPALQEALVGLCRQATPAWVDIHYQGRQLVPDLREQLEHYLDGSPVEILRIGNAALRQHGLLAEHTSESLESLTPEEVFQRCLDQQQLPQEQQEWLWPAFRDVLQGVREEDPQSGHETPNAH